MKDNIESLTALLEVCIYVLLPNVCRVVDTYVPPFESRAALA